MNDAVEYRPIASSGGVHHAMSSSRKLNILSLKLLLKHARLKRPIHCSFVYAKRIPQSLFTISIELHQSTFFLSCERMYCFPRQA